MSEFTEDAKKFWRDLTGNDTPWELRRLLLLHLVILAILIVGFICMAAEFKPDMMANLFHHQPIALKRLLLMLVWVLAGAGVAMLMAPVSNYERKVRERLGGKFDRSKK